MVTILDIAKLADVSRTTVSRVLNDSGYVSEKARSRVLEAIEQTGYIPSEQAKSLRTKKTKVIGVILPKISTETASRVVNGIDDILREKGYQILLSNANLQVDKEIEQMKLLESRRVDGIILLATNIQQKLLSAIKELKVPLVALGQDIPDVPSVVYDDYHAAKDLTNAIIDRGHKRIGFIGVPETDRAVGYLRKEGYLDAMNEKGLAVEKSWIQKGKFDIESGRRAMKRILSESKEVPTATFAVTDRLAIGAMEFLKEQHISVPDEMAMAGIGASEISSYITPPLTTVDYNNENAGMETAKLLLEKINGNAGKMRKLSMDYRLMIRDSLR
ncbi:MULTISPECIES: LacI family DNA-binding transcriptional regulator [Alteribacter]|uniref:LacI family transcriptional regulator n=1 Tax=Alteribacter keqinensis TaxID=2483800 RepID=A0A3M7TMH1_9BACI|nr:MULTISPECIES: LacI family DNA-binding transcriptional regulator [Alteribacter]MBM7096773.1 LacI family DNA-binding transcriptional regulator [Alteribacter salitolerans]RNA66370.1 LacI family transcriptional regulator [Alteribacter keqinensis]